MILRHLFRSGQPRYTSSQLNTATKRAHKQCLQQRRNFYFSVPFILVPGLIAFVSITVYQVYKKQQVDELNALSDTPPLQWRAKEVVYYGVTYARRESSDEVYDLQSYKQALKGEGEPVLIGHWAVDEGGRQHLRLLCDKAAE